MAWTNVALPNLADYQTFTYAIRVPSKQGYTGFTPKVIAPASPYWQMTLNVSTAIVAPELKLACGSGSPPTTPSIYCLAVYNLGVDRLVNFAQDVSGQTFFGDLRQWMKIESVSVGVASQVSDNGTAVGILNPHTMENFTLNDLQNLKTPWGRQYLAFAQMVGYTVFGLS